MIYRKEKPFTLKELTDVVDKVCVEMNISMAKLGKDCYVPDSIWIEALSGVKPIPKKYQDNISNYIDINNIDSAFEDEFVFKKISYLQLKEKKLWYNEVLEGVQKSIINRKL